MRSADNHKVAAMSHRGGDQPPLWDVCVVQLSFLAALFATFLLLCCWGGGGMLVTQRKLRNCNGWSMACVAF